jgi:hypothetical protein
MSRTVARPDHWLVIALEWRAPMGAQYAECALAIAPSFIPRGLLSPPVDMICEFSRAISSTGFEQVLTFSELSQTLGRHGQDWSAIGVPDWEAAIQEIEQAPVPSLYLTLSQYAHMLLSTTGQNSVSVPGPNAPQPIGQADYDTLRCDLRVMLTTDWARYIEDMQRQGVIRPAP